MAKINLQPEVAALFDTAASVVTPKAHFNGFGVVNLEQLLLPEAQSLAAQGFSWLVAKAEPTTQAAPVIPPAKQKQTPPPGESGVSSGA